MHRQQPTTPAQDTAPASPGGRQWMSGNEALARGAFEAGVTVACGYPGTPSTDILESLCQYQGVHAEWAPNEKVALEAAIGASFAGARGLATMKHVGLNVAADPLFTAAYTGVLGGLVVICADDPEMHSSQNEQDSRNYALAAKLPMLEPADPAEARVFVREAFALSEAFDIPVLVRSTTRLSHVEGVVEPEERQEPAAPALHRAPAKLVMLPANARQRRRDLAERWQRLQRLAEESPLNETIIRDRSIGVITAGVAALHVQEVLPEASLLKLGMVNPLPVERIREFAAQVDELYVVEDLDPVIETQVRALGIGCRGKDVVPAIGELSPTVLRRAFGRDPRHPGFPAPDLVPRPPNMCAGCPHRGLFYNLARLKVFVSGDIGCYTLGFLPPLAAMDTCVCMGASIPMAHGMAKALGPGGTDRIVAVIGDSTFCHSGITGLLNSAYNGNPTTVVILDNRTTAMTGHQPNPVSGSTLMGEPAHEVDLERLCRALGVEHVRVVDPHDLPACRKVLEEEIGRDELSVVISRAPCALLPEVRKAPRIPLAVDISACTGCGACLRLGCPAIVWTPTTREEATRLGLPKPDKQKGHASINTMCIGCGQCRTLCKFNAIHDAREGC